MIGMAGETAPGFDVVGIEMAGSYSLEGGPNRKHRDCDGEPKEYGERKGLQVRFLCQIARSIFSSHI